MLKKISIKKMKPVLGLILFSVAITIIRPNFMTSANLLNVLRQTSINAISCRDDFCYFNRWD